MITKQIELPSGLTVTIRPPGPRASVLMAEDPEDRLNAIRMVCACTKEPRLTEETIDDVLDFIDFAALVEAVTELVEDVRQRTRPTSKVATVS